MITLEKFKAAEDLIQQRKWLLEFQAALASADRVRISVPDSQKENVFSIFMPSIWVKGGADMLTILAHAKEEVARQLADVEAEIGAIGIAV